MAKPEDGLKFAENLIHSQTAEDTFDWVLRDLKDFQASDGHFSCVLPVSNRTRNRFGTLHGGCTGASLHIFFCCTGLLSRYLWS